VLSSSQKTDLLNNITKNSLEISSKSDAKNETVENVKLQQEFSNIIDESDVKNQTTSSNTLKFGLGKAKQSVYVYHYDIYKDKHISKGEKYYPCKIGTSINPYDRIDSQIGTSQPEPAIVDILIFTDKAEMLEKTIHNVLHLRNRKVESQKGKEWFYTNPSEVLTIIGLINPVLLQI